MVTWTVSQCVTMSSRTGYLVFIRSPSVSLWKCDMDSSLGSATTTKLSYGRGYDDDAEPEILCWIVVLILADDSLGSSSSAFAFVLLPRRAAARVLN